MANFYGAGIGFGSGGAAGGWVFQGDEYGYLAGGTYHIPPSISADHVDKFAIASDSDSSASGMGTVTLSSAPICIPVVSGLREPAPAPPIPR